MNPIDFIRTLHPFDALSDAEFTQLADAAERVEVPPNETILRQDGPPSTYLYVIESGMVNLAKDGIIYRVLERGEIFGDSVLIRNETESSDVVADGPLTLLRIPDTACQRLIGNDDFSAYFLRGLSERLRMAKAEAAPPIEQNLATPVKVLMTRNLVTIEPSATVQEAAQLMRDAHVSSTLVTADPPGILTDRDLRSRVLAEGLDPATLVQAVMTQPIKTLDSDVPVYAALIHMLAENIHHLPLVEEGQVVGMVTSSDLLRHQARSPLHLLRWVERMESGNEIGQYARQSGEMVDSLFRGGLEAAKIGQIVSSLNDELVTRLLRLAEAELGPPPVPYAWIVFGSEGRLEQMLLTDQDNALIYAEASSEAEVYFGTLAEQVINGLIQAGFPPCPGGYMATKWCQPLAEWQSTFQQWVRRPDRQALMEAAIFFDFRSVHGDLSLDPLEQIVTSAKDGGGFIGQMVRAAQEFATPLTFFRQIRQDDAGTVDLKAGGIAPIVGLARACSLAAGSRERSTLERLTIAAESGTMSQNGADNLAEIFRFLLKLRLRHQLEALHNGETPTNRIPLNTLSPIEKRHLKEAFVVVREMQEGIGSLYGG